MVVLTNFNCVNTTVKSTRLSVLSELARIVEKPQKSVKMSTNPISVGHPNLIRKTTILDKYGNNKYATIGSVVHK